jgi:lipoyl(octanoyl) transferase
VSSWRVSPLTLATAAEQLARSEALWREVAAGEAPPTMRWYGYSAPAVVLGVGQSLRAVDADVSRAAGVAVVRRASGGTAVLADETMLALDVAVPPDHPRAGSDILEAYRWLGEVFRDALAALAPPGVAGRIGMTTVAGARADQEAQRRAPPGSSGALRGLACFGTLSPYEVVLAGADGTPDRKVVGLSQVRKRGVVLYQVGLYRTVRARDLARLLAILAISENERARLAAELPRRVAGVESLGLEDGPLSAGGLGALRARVEELVLSG